MKKNCWEMMRCGREPGGARVAELGVCPVPLENSLHGANSGRNAGRACWTVAGSLCGGAVQGAYAEKLHNCWKCEFMSAVKKEEEPEAHGFTLTRLGMKRVLERSRN